MNRTDSPGRDKPRPAAFRRRPKISLSPRVRLPGGHLAPTVEWAAALLTFGAVGQLSIDAARAAFFELELVTKRGGDEGSYNVGQLVKLGMRRDKAAAGIKQLSALGLHRWADTSIEFLQPIGPDHALWERFQACLEHLRGERWGRPRTRLAIVRAGLPRWLLSATWSDLVLLLESGARVLRPNRDGSYSIDGQVNLSRAAAAYGISPRALQAAASKAHGEGRGWLARKAFTPQLVRNGRKRSPPGELGALQPGGDWFDLVPEAFGAIVERLPEDPRNCTPAPPDAPENCTPSVNQLSSGGALTIAAGRAVPAADAGDGDGLCSERTRTPGHGTAGGARPRGHVTFEDLRDAAATLALGEPGRRSRGWILSADPRERNVQLQTAAEETLWRVALGEIGNPGAYFSAILRRPMGDVRPLTHYDEVAARAMARVLETEGVAAPRNGHPDSLPGRILAQTAATREETARSAQGAEKPNLGSSPVISARQRPANAADPAAQLAFDVERLRALIAQVDRAAAIERAAIYMSPVRIAAALAVIDAATPAAAPAAEDRVQPATSPASCSPRAPRRPTLRRGALEQRRSKARGALARLAGERVPHVVEQIGVGDPVAIDWPAGIPLPADLERLRHLVRDGPLVVKVAPFCIDAVHLRDVRVIAWPTGRPDAPISPNGEASDAH